MHFHLIGIGGIAMAQLAYLLKKLGYRVSGSDKQLYPPVSHKLEQWGIDYHDFNQEDLKAPDAVIVGNAISRGNRALEFALAQQLPIFSMPQVIHSLLLLKKKNIVVSGTHGKTTTTFLIDHLLGHAGYRPGLFCGGFLKNGEAGARLGKDDLFVIEGDEYDSAFFDKQAKFLHYFPTVLLITSLEYDHLDIYPDFAAYQRAFILAIRMVPENGLIVANGNYPQICEMLQEHALSPVVFYCSPDKLASLQRFHQELPSNRLAQFQFFSYRQKNDHWIFETPGESLDLQLPADLAGEINRQNTMAALLTLQFLLRTEPRKNFSLSQNSINQSLASFQGVKRRQELLYQSKDGLLAVYEDFAHHPTAVSGLIQVIRELNSLTQIVVFFEPRSNSSHHRSFTQGYIDSLAQADQIYLSAVFNKQKFSRENLLDSRSIVHAINQKKSVPQKNIKTRADCAHYGKNPQELLEKFKKNWQNDKRNQHKNMKATTLVFLSNGSFDGIALKTVDFLKNLNKQKNQ